MNSLIHMRRLVLLGAALGLGACTVLAPVPADRSAAVARQSLETLKADPEVAANAADALAEAEQSVQIAEGPQDSAVEAAQRGFIAAERVQIAVYTAAANRDRAAYEKLIAQRDAIRHGSGSITTLATDALGVTPQSLQFKPIDNSAPLPPASPIANTPPLPAARTTAPAPTAAAKVNDEPSPLLALYSSAFADGAALKPAARAALDKLVPVLMRHAQRHVLVCYGSVSTSAMQRASSVRDYLVAHGIARQRLFVAAVADAHKVPSGGISIDFE